MKKIFFYIILLYFSGISAQEQFSVYFDSNKFEPIAKEKQRLNQWISENGTSKIVAINGYTDEDGTSGYNDTLAKKRVDFIFNIVKEKVKIREDFKSRSFGENHNLSNNKAENRKATIYFIPEKDLPREDEILGIKKEIPAEKPKPQPVKYPASILFSNPNGTKTNLQLDTVFMKKIHLAKVGEKLKLQNLNFKINTFIVEQESLPKMFELLVVLRNNPKLKIQINGHLCCMKNDKQDLSTQRAKAIYSFLTNYEIDKSRLSYKGFGVSDPLFSIPEKSETEAAANRRVEIEIIENQ